MIKKDLPQPHQELSRREFLLRLAGISGLAAAATVTALEVSRRNNEAISPFETQSTLDLNFEEGELTNDDLPNLFNFEEGNKVAEYTQALNTFTSRRENSYIEEGALVIQALVENLNDRKYSSARLSTKGIFDMQEGKLEVTAKLPKGKGTWAAIWLQTSSTNRTDGASAAEKAQAGFTQRNGEIDLVEAVGHRPGEIFTNIHTQESVASGTKPNQKELDLPDASDVFHTYSVEWTKTAMTFTLDGKPYHQVKIHPETDPFDHLFNLTINLNIGGRWPGTDIDESQAEFWKLYIRRIRSWPLKKSE